MFSALTLSALTDNLVPFYARRVATLPIWRAPDADNLAAMQSACSYLSDPTAPPSACAKLFYAERYGGSGLQRNGGGARCGFDGDYQVKGIGINPLAGEGSDKRHSDGVLSVVHAIYEALWGEVLAQILPYGAVRTQAIFLINDKTGNDAIRRALLIRKPVIRPAHFERAPWFRPRPEFAAQLPSDARRVSSVIRLLPASLPVPPAGFSKEACRDPQLYCLEGLEELARRLAKQMAFCRTRFLRMTTSPSNVAMDGRLMDFNGLNCLFPGDYLYDFGYRLRLQELMKEPEVLQQGLADLCLYLGKYMFTPAYTAVARRQVEKTFQRTFQQASCFGYLELLGIPAHRLPLTEMPEIAQRLVVRFIRLFDSLKANFYCPQGNTTSDSPLIRLTVALIRSSQDQAYADGESLRSNPHFTAAAQDYRRLLHWLTLNENAALAELKTVEQQARQKNQSRSFLRKERMFSEITGLLAEHGDDVQALQQAISAMAKRMQIFARASLGGNLPAD